MEVRIRPAGVALLSMGFLFLGIATLVMIVASGFVGRAPPPMFLLPSAVYGVAATITGWALWRGMGLARVSYGLWCAAIGVSTFELRDYLVAGSIPGIAALVILLALGYRYISKNVGHGAPIAPGSQHASR